MGRIQGLELLEVGSQLSREWSTCCGGGNLEISDPHLSERMGLRRAEELLSTKASVIVTHCPACVMQLRRCVKKINPDVEVKDLVEILNDVME